MELSRVNGEFEEVLNDLRNEDKPRPKTCGLYERVCAISNVLSTVASSGNGKYSAVTNVDGESNDGLSSGISGGSCSASVAEEVEEDDEEAAGCSAYMNR